MATHTARYSTYSVITVYRRASSGVWTKVDTYRDTTLGDAQHDYERLYKHDEQSGTEILFVGGGEILALARVEIPEPVRRFVGVAIR